MDREKLETSAAGLHPEVFDHAKQIEALFEDFKTQKKDISAFANSMLQSEGSASYTREDDDYSVSTLVRIGDNQDGNRIYLAAVRQRSIDTGTSNCYFTAFVGIPLSGDAANIVEEEGFRYIGKDTSGHTCFGYELVDLREHYEKISFISRVVAIGDEFDQERADLDTRLKNIQNTVALIKESIANRDLNPGAAVTLAKVSRKSLE